MKAPNYDRGLVIIVAAVLLVPFAFIQLLSLLPK